MTGSDKNNKMNCELMLTYDTPALRQDSYFLFADLVGFYTHWTYMHIFRHIFLSNYWWQKSDIWSQASYRYPISWEAFSVLPSVQDMMLVTKYQISVINSCWEKCDEKYLGRTERRTEGWTEVKQYTPSPFRERGYNNQIGIDKKCLKIPNR
jgi:hypothetical protein